MTPSQDFPGKFVLSYMPVAKVKHEYFTVTPEGFRFRQQIFPGLMIMLTWFKEHYREPPPGSKHSYKPIYIFFQLFAQLNKIMAVGGKGGGLRETNRF